MKLKKVLTINKNIHILVLHNIMLFVCRRRKNSEPFMLSVGKVPNILESVSFCEESFTYTCKNTPGK